MLLRPVHWRVIFGLGMTLGWLTSASAQAPHSEGLTPSDREQLIALIMQAELETMSEETPPYLAKALSITMDSAAVLNRASWVTKYHEARANGVEPSASWMARLHSVTGQPTVPSDPRPAADRKFTLSIASQQSGDSLLVTLATRISGCSYWVQRTASSWLLRPSPPVHCWIR